MINNRYFLNSFFADHLILSITLILLVLSQTLRLFGFIRKS